MTDKQQGMLVKLGHPGIIIYTPDYLRITAADIRKAIERQWVATYSPKRKWTPRRWR